MSPIFLLMVGGGLIVGFLVYDWITHRMRGRLKKGRAIAKKKVSSKIDWKVYALGIYTVVVFYLYIRGLNRAIVPEGMDPIDVEAVIKRAWAPALFILIVGGWLTWRQSKAARVGERLLITGQVAELVAAFKSVFRIRPTVFNALEESNKKIPQPVGGAVAHAVTTFYVTAHPARAWSELRERIQDPYMEQFVYILQRGEDSKHEDIMVALDGLLKRLRRARELRDKSEVNMTVVTGQTRIIQLIALAMIAVIGFVPMLRELYEYTAGQIMFLIVAGISVGTSYIIERKAVTLKEKVL